MCSVLITVVTRTRITYFLLTEREGLTGRILLEVFLVRNERSEVRTRKTEGNSLRVWSRASES